MSCDELRELRSKCSCPNQAITCSVDNMLTVGWSDEEVSAWHVQRGKTPLLVTRTRGPRLDIVPTSSFFNSAFSWQCLQRAWFRVAEENLRLTF